MISTKQLTNNFDNTIPSNVFMKSKKTIYIPLDFYLYSPFYTHILTLKCIKIFKIEKKHG